ncbi:MAG TPA: CRTAC1 family protein [Terriglobia bacterium]|nr:CRTAC1 family protein [Terriglobia bacterium]
MKFSLLTFLVFSAVLLGLSILQVLATPSRPRMHFREIAKQAGLTTVPHSSSERHYIVETMGGGGIALLDCDNDGKLDLAVVNDSAVERYLRGGDPMITLYHQDSGPGNLHFTDVTQSAGLTTRGWGMGIAAGDYDNDGLSDIYVTGYGHNVLYHNLGGCKFEDVTEKAGLKIGGFSVGAAWADYDRDGHIDLFVARYVDFDVYHLPTFDPRASGYGSFLQLPGDLPGETDYLFRNRGDGTFEDVSQRAGVYDVPTLHGMGVVWGDYDNDGWPDLFVTNDGGPNFLYHNKHDGTFQELGLTSGTAVGTSGELFGNMAADFSDFNRDGKLGLVVSRYTKQHVGLYRNDGYSIFSEMATEARIDSPTMLPVKWGVGFGDFDNDGWPDILIANGNFSSLMDAVKDEVKYSEPILLLRNLGNRTFDEISDRAGLNDGPLKSRRGTAFGDVNNDGNLDVVIFNANGAPSLFLNETRNTNHRVLFRLVGTRSNRAAVGARVTVYSHQMTQIDEVRAGGSYNSTNDSRLHFGLGRDGVMSKVTVQWPSGVKQEFTNVAGDAIYGLVEGSALKRIAPLRPPTGTE